MNLFKKIWEKNFLKAKEPIDKFSEDIGGIKGEFSWIKYRNGKIVDNFNCHNQITHLSKSTVIRLLAQGSSRWRESINPADYRISRMRFGNAPYISNEFNYNSDLMLTYYDTKESINRPNLTNSTNLYSPAGGRFIDGSGGPATGVINGDSKSSINRTFQVSTSFTNWEAGAIISINITSAVFSSIGNTLNLIENRPPSHKTLVIDFLNSLGSIVASLKFGTIYSRDPNGNQPSEKITGANLISSNDIDHKLYYDYTTSTWKIQFKLGTGVVSNIVNLRVSFKTGVYNVVNSIVPKTGYNSGSGDGFLRFPLGGIDYYNTYNVTYEDAGSSSFIDDYSATFSINMAQNEGNGSSGLPVYYTEAFLFNSKDDLFSIVRFPYYQNITETPKGFEKDATISYLISWTIKSLT